MEGAKWNFYRLLQLGPLPEFGRKRGGLAGSVGVGGSSQSQLDDVLGSLLGSDERDDQSKPRTKDPQARTKKKKAE